MTWYRHEEYQDMVQTQGRSGHGTDTRKIWTWYRRKEDLDMVQAQGRSGYGIDKRKIWTSDMVWTQGRSRWFTAGHFLA